MGTGRKAYDIARYHDNAMDAGAGMSFPRRQFVPADRLYYRRYGSRHACAALRCDWATLRRWLVEQGEPIHKRGPRLHHKANV